MRTIIPTIDMSNPPRHTCSTCKAPVIGITRTNPGHEWRYFDVFNLPCGHRNMQNTYVSSSRRPDINDTFEDPRGDISLTPEEIAVALLLLEKEKS